MATFETIQGRRFVRQTLGPVAVIGWFNLATWAVGFEFVRFGMIFYAGPVMVGVAKL